MTFLDLVQISATALLRHKIRSCLTLLGIVIGIISVAAVMSVVRGIDRYVADLLGSIGSQGFVVTRMGIPGSEEEYLKALRRRPIPPSAAEAIKWQKIMVACEELRQDVTAGEIEDTKKILTEEYEKKMAKKKKAKTIPIKEGA